MTVAGGPPSYDRATEPDVARPAGSTAASGEVTDSTDQESERARGRLPVGLSVLGGSIVLAAVTIAGTLVENRPQDFNWSAFLVGLIGTVLLLAGAAAVGLLGRAWRSGLPAVLGSFGLLGVAVMELSWLQPRHDDWSVYVAGVFLLVFGALGWWLLRGSALLVVAGLGGLLMLAQAASDVVDGSSAQDDPRGPVLWVALVLAAYGVAFAAGLWWLPSRHVTGLTGVAFAVTSMATASYLLALVGAFDVASSLDGEGNPVAADQGVSWYAVAALVIGLLICAGAVAVWTFSGHLGYAVVGVVGAAIITTAGITAAAPDAILRWSTGLGLLGVVALAAGLVPGLRQRRSRRDA